MKDRYKNNLFFNGENEYSNSFQIQSYVEEVFEKEGITINLFPIDSDIHITTKEKKKIISEWLDILPNLNKLKSLSIRHKVDIEFFQKICQIDSLESLEIWSSNIADISEISKLKNLKRLDLKGFNKLINIKPVTKLKELQKFSIEKSFIIENYRCISELNNLIGLQLNGDLFAPKNLKLENISFINELKNLEHLDLLNCNILSKDLSPINELKNLKRLDINEKVSSEMKKSILESNKKLNSGFFVDWDFQLNKFYPGKDW